MKIVTTFNRPISYKLIKKTILVHQIHKMLCITVKNLGFNILLLLLVCCYEAILWSSMKQYWIFPKITSLFQIYQSNVKRFSYNCYVGLLNKIKVMLDLSIRYDSVSMAKLFVVQMRNQSHHKILISLESYLVVINKVFNKLQVTCHAGFQKKMSESGFCFLEENLMLICVVTTLICIVFLEFWKSGVNDIWHRFFRFLINFVYKVNSSFFSLKCNILSFRIKLDIYRCFFDSRKK